MKTIYRDNAERITVADAKRLILEAVPRENSVSVYARMDEHGNIDFDGPIEVRANDNASIQSLHLDGDFLETCKQVGIQPRMKYRPVMTDYTGAKYQDETYTIAHDEFVKMAGLFSVVVAVGKAPAHNTAPPAPVAKPVKRKPNKPSIESVALDYMRKEYQSAQFKSAAVFHKHLIKTAGVKESPFEAGTGTNARRLFCRAAGSFFDVGTLGKYWPKIRAA